VRQFEVCMRQDLRETRSKTETRQEARPKRSKTEGRQESGLRQTFQVFMESQAKPGRSLGNQDKPLFHQPIVEHHTGMITITKWFVIGEAASA
jgi:hypothetical protein